MSRFLSVLTSICALMTACTTAKKPENLIIRLPESVCLNSDSVKEYTERAYRDNDPQAQFVVGACYYLQQQGELPDNIRTVSCEEANNMLWHSADQDYQPARDLIYDLNARGLWNRTIPHER